MITLQLS